MTAAERALVRTMASILAEMVFRQPNVTMRSANSSMTMRGSDVEIILQRQIEDLGADPAPLTPRPKYVSIEHAPDPGEAASRWKYARTQKDVWIDSPRDGDKHAALLAAGENITHADVAAVLGASWAYLSCDGCDETELVRAVSIHGQYYSGHKYCPTCIREAAALLDTME